jgi:hypothetical protein
MYRFHEVHIVNQHLVWDDRSEIYYVGPDSEFRDSRIDIGISAAAWVLTKTRLINCDIRVKRQLTSFGFDGAYLERCRLRGRFVGCDFGRRDDHADFPSFFPEAGIVDTDLSAARLDGCRFISCDLSTLKLPRWPFFTIREPEQVREQALKLPWPGSSHLILGSGDDPPGTVAYTDDARQICKQFDVTEAELRAVVEQIPGVIL